VTRNITMEWKGRDGKGRKCDRIKKRR